MRFPPLPIERIYLSSSLVVAAVVLTFVLVGTALAVRVGTEGATNEKTIFMLGYDTVSSSSSSATSYRRAVGTAGNAKYERCLITACHVIHNRPEVKAFKAETNHYDLTAVDNETKRQDVAGVGRLFSDRCADGMDPLAQYDMAVLWLTNYKDGTLKRIEAGRDYTPFSLERAENMGLSRRTWADGSWTNLNLTSTGAPQAVSLIGFGDNATESLGGGIRIDRGKGVMRSGSTDADLFYADDPAQLLAMVGSIIRSRSVTPGWNAGCAADSGTPLIHSGKFYGVYNSTLPDVTYCADAAVDFYASFDDVNSKSFLDGGSETNWKRITRLVEKTCGKTLNTGINFGQGNIYGSFTPQWTDPDGSKEFNGLINCYADFDCTEFMHEGDSITLTATPATSWEFDKWEGGGSSACPCHQSTAANCTVSYDQMGYYTDQVSSDHSYCQANFKQQSSSSVSSVASSASSSESSSEYSSESSSSESSLESSSSSYSS